MATFRDILLEVTGDASDAERTLDGLSARLSEIADRQYRAHVTLSGTEQVRAQVATVEGELAALGSRDVTIPVKLDRRTLTNELRAAAAEAERAMHGGGSRGGQFNIGGDAARVGADLGRGMEDATQGGDQLIRTVSQGRDGVVGFGFSLVGLRSALMGVGVAILVTAAPAIAALGASLVGAAAAAGGMAVALAGALGPAALVAVGAFQGLAKVIAAVQAMRQDRSLQKTTQGQQAAATAATQHARAVTALGIAQRDAGREIRNSQHENEIAQRSVSDATRNLKLTTVDAYDAWADAIDKVGDSMRQLQHAELDVQRAKLDHQSAVLALQQLRRELGLTGAEFDGLFNQITDVRLSPEKLKALMPQVDALGLTQANMIRLKQAVLDVADSNLKVKDSQDAVNDSSRAYNRAQRERNRYTREGIMAYGPLRSATEGLADAQWAAARAQEHYNDVLRLGVQNAPSVVAARDALRSATLQLSAATQKGQTAFEQVPDSLKPLVRLLDQLATAWKTVSDSIGHDVTRAMTVAIGGVTRLLDHLGPRIRGLSGTIGDQFSKLFAGMTGNRATHFFDAMFASANKLLPVVERIVEDLLGLAGNIAQAATPALSKFLGYLERVFGAWDKDSGSKTGMQRMTDFFTKGEQALERWLNLIGAVGRLVLDFFGATSDQSNGMLDSLTKTVNKWDQWVRDAKNADKIHDAVERARHILGDVFTILGKIVDVFNALEPVAVDVFNVIAAIVNPFLSIMRNILNATKGLPAPLREIGGLVAGLIGVGGPFLIWKGLIAVIKSGMGGLASLIVSRFGPGSRTRRVLESVFENLGWKNSARRQAGTATETAAEEVTRNRGRIRTALSGAWRAAGDAVARAGQFLGLGGAGALLRSLKGRLLARGVGMVATLAGVLGAESVTAAAMVSLGATLGLVLGTALVGALIGTLLRKIPAIRHAADWVASHVLGTDKQEQKDQQEAKINDKIQQLTQQRAHTRDPAKIAEINRAIRQLAKMATFVRGFQVGGVIPGFGGGDIVPIRVEPGEGILRKEVVSKLGTATINALNAGYPTMATVRGGYANGGVVGGWGGGDMHFHIPPAAPSATQPDPAITAALLSQHMRARGLRLS